MSQDELVAASIHKVVVQYFVLLFAFMLPIIGKILSINYYINFNIIFKTEQWASELHFVY